MTDVREVDHFTNVSAVPVRGAFHRRGRRGGRIGRELGLGRGSARNTARQFTYNAPINEVEIQNRLLQNGDASHFPGMIGWDGREESPPGFSEPHIRREVLGGQSESYWEAVRTLTRSVDGGAAESTTPRMVRWPTSSVGRRATARGGRSDRVSESQRSADETRSHSTSRHRREPLGPRLRRIEAERYGSMVARPFKLPPLPSPTRIAPEILEQMDLAPPTIREETRRLLREFERLDEQIERGTSARFTAYRCTRARPNGRTK